MVKRKERLFAQLMFTCDELVLAASFGLAYWLRDQLRLPGSSFPLAFRDYLWAFPLVALCWTMACWRFQLFESRAYRSPSRTFRSLLKAHILASLALFTILYLLGWPGWARLRLGLFVAISFGGLIGEKFAVKAALDMRARRLRKQQAWRVLIVGDEEHARLYRQLLAEHAHWAVEVTDVISPQAVAGGGLFVNGDGPDSVDWSLVLKGYVVDEVVATVPWQDASYFHGLNAACAERGIVFRVLVKMPEPPLGAYHVDDLGRGVYLVSLETVPHEAIPLLVKRALDLVGAVVGLALCGLVYLWYAPRLKRESPGPVLFRQPRGGLGGRQFTVYKFRTMYLDAEARLKELQAHNEMRGAIFKMRDDPRIVPVGRTLRKAHLDEMPQFFNVLKGEMSLVGPRPCPITEVERYNTRQLRRLSMKPGITGPWQLNGNAQVNDFDEIVRLDCEYIDNWSLLTDMKIIAATVVKVAQRDGW